VDPSNDGEAEDDVGSVADELVRGTPTSERTEIGKVVLGSSDCSGTLIAPNVVLTAAHCFGFRSSTAAGNHGSFRVYASASSWRSYRIAEYVSLGTSPGRSDIAVARLASDVPSSRAVPTRFASARPADGAPMSMYGFGTSSRSPSSASYRKRRFDFVQGSVTREAAGGDSGGPVVDRRTGAVTAVISGYSRETGIDALADVPAFHAAIAARVAAWAGAPPPPASCGAWAPFTEWTCSGDGVTRGRCTTGGAVFERCPSACVPASGGANCR